MHKKQQTTGKFKLYKFPSQYTGRLKCYFAILEISFF